MLNEGLLCLLLGASQSVTSPVLMDASYTLQHPIQPHDALVLVDIEWSVISPVIDDPEVTCKWRDIITGNTTENQGTMLSHSQVTCSLPLIANVDLLLTEIVANNGLWYIRYEGWQSRVPKTVRVYDANLTSQSMVNFPVSMPNRALPIVDSGYGLETILVVSGPFKPYVGHWTIGCAFQRIAGPQVDVLVEGHLNGDFTELECLLPYNYSRYEYIQSLHIVAMHSETGSELARLSQGSPLPLLTNEVFTISGSSSRWGLAGVDLEVMVYGRSFPMEDYVGLLCHFEGLDYTRAVRINESTISCPTPGQGQSPGVDSRLTILYDTSVQPAVNWRPHEEASTVVYPATSYDQFEVPLVTAFEPFSRFLYPMSHNDSREVKLTHQRELPVIMLPPNSLWCEYSPSLGSPNVARTEENKTVYCPVPTLHSSTNITAISVHYSINGTHQFQPRDTTGSVLRFDIVPRAQVLRIVKNSSVVLQMAPPCGPPKRFVAEVEALNVVSGEDSCALVLSPVEGLLPGRLTTMPSGTYQCNVPIVVSVELEQRLGTFPANSSDIIAHVVVGKLESIDLQNDEVRNLLLRGVAEVPISITTSNNTADTTPLALISHGARLLHEKCVDGSWNMWKRTTGRQLSGQQQQQQRDRVDFAASRRRLVHSNYTMPIEEASLDWLKHNVSLKAVVPDWSFHNGGGIVVLTGTFVPPSIFNFSAILVNFGQGGPRASATLMNESAINCTVPAMPDNFFDTVQLSVTVVFLSPFNSTHVNITAQGPGLVFSYLPNLALGSLVPRTGPPGGLTNVTMRVMFFANFSTGLERDLGLDFDCAIGTFRSPARFRLADESSLAGYAMNRTYEVWCSAPMAGPRRDVCVQLVPRLARSIENPLQPCNNTMGRHRLEYNYYRQMPRVDSLSPAVGLYEGGTDVVVSGKNFPDNTTFPGFPEVLCKFDIYIFEGRRIDNTSVVCESPAVVYHCNSSAVGCNSNDSLEVSVTLSFNAGRDWSFTSVNFTYAPRSSIVSLWPSFGPATGGTRLTALVVTSEFLVRNFCVGDQVMPVTSKASNGNATITEIEGIVPPLQRNDTTRISTWTVGVSTMQDDGRCLESSNNFTYVDMWNVESVEPTQGIFQNVHDSAALLVTGNNFYMHSDAVCRFSISMMVNASALGTAAYNVSWRYGDLSKRALADLLSQRDCDVQVPARVLDWNRLMCGPEFGVDYIDRTIAACGSDLLAAALSSETRYTIVLSSLKMAVAVAMNGVDYSPAITYDADQAWGLLYAVFLAPQIVGFLPAKGPEVGGYPIVLQVSGSTAWRVTSCRFQPVEGAPNQVGHWVDVPATTISDHEISCIAPLWHIEDGNRTAVVSISLEISETLWTNSTQFTYYKSPSIKHIDPAEGPHEGGTRVTVYGEGFDLYLVRDGLGSGMSCIFGRTVVTAHYLSPTEIFCFTPPSTTASPSVKGQYVNLDLSLDFGPTPGVTSVTMMPLYQQLFYYRFVRFSVTSARPLSGPRSGGTLVDLYSDAPFPTTDLLSCGFGRQLVVAQQLSPYHINCIAPSVGAPGVVNLSLSADNQTRSELTVIDNTTLTTIPLQFTYYFGATVASVSPSFGGTEGGTRVLLRGSHFLDSPDLSCKFGTTVVTVRKFISPSAIVCESPPHPEETVVVSVANNGRDFISGIGTVYDYMASKPQFILDPFLGPVSGDTRVTIRTADPLSIPRSIWQAAMSTAFCIFGTLRVTAAVDVDSSSLVCTSPPTTEPGEVRLMVSLNGHDIEDASQGFLYYSSPNITLVEPSMGPQGQATYITLSGGGFINTHFLTVMFGGISAIGESIPYKTRKAMWLSDSRIQVESPELSPSGELRVPLYISNNGQNFSPDGIDSWDADDDSHDDPKSLKYYTFHLPVAVYSVSPREGNIHGGGLVSVNGGPFVKTSNLLCSFDWVHVDPTVARPVVVSSTQVLCPVPDMWDARTADALNRRAKIRITLNGIDWSLSYATFTFYSMSPPGFTTHHTGELTFTSQIRSCPAGHMCEEFGLSHPLPCPPGSYQPRVGSRQCLECPKGYYCPRVRMERPVICPAGWVCDEEGLMTPYKRCPAGFICLEGTATGSEAPVVTTLVESNNPNINTAGLNAPKLCPRGLHCYPGTLALRSSPGNLSTPQPCSQGFFCPPGSAMPYGAGACPPGKYCPVPRSAGIVCKPRFRCGPMPGQFEPTECPAGTFNPYHGQHNCTLCREGGVCPFPLMDRPKPAECGYVAARKGIKSHSGNDLCPAGRICSWGVATTSEPKICTTISYDSAVNISSLEESCKSELGQAFVPRERARLVRIGGVVPNTWNDSLGLCCWDSDRVLQFLTGVALYYEGLRNPLINEARATWTLVGKVRQVNAEDRIRDSTAAGFDGLEMLANFTDDSLRLSWRVHLTRVRRKILLEIARQYFFKGPEPCPKGTFCNTGTCADLMTVISDSGQTYSSRRRRLEAEDIAGVDGVTRRKALPDSAIEYANMPKADLVRMEKDEQDEAIIQIRMLTSTERISSYPLGGVRLLQSDSGGELQTITLSGNHPLAIRAPQQCLAGTYCSIRANSSLGTSLCSAGQYCPSGASEPFPAPEGEFVGEVARVRGRMCTPGKFAPNPSSPICYPCPPGYSCPNFGTRTLFLCPPGTFRRSSGDDVASVFDDETPVVVGESGDALESSISCTPCDVGTWTVLRGTEDETGCDPCPAGRFCFTKTGNLSETNPCPEGYICGEGTTLETASKIPCLNGYYCGTGTSPISVYDSLCLKEFYCPEGTTYANRYNFRCPTGFYCPPGTGWKPDMDVPLRPNSAYIKYSDFLILQVAAQYCLRQIHAAEFKQIELINAESLNNELLDELPEAEVQTRLSQWTSSMSFCVQSQVEYIPMLAEGAEGVAKSLYEDEDWHSRQLQALQTPWKAPYEYSNKCLNDTFPRMRNGSTWDCLCHEEINDGHLMRCLTRAVDPYDEPYGAPFRYDIDDELSSTSCSPWPDCIDWSRVSQDNSAPGPEGGPYWDDFDRLAVSFIDYVRDALVKEMERTATDIDDNGESKQSITRCPFGTLTSEDAASELAMCTKRKSIVSLEDNADIIVSRVNPVAMANVESIPRPIPASQQGTIIPVIDDEDERIVYSLPARASAIITLDLRRLPSGVEYGRDWRVRVFVNDSLPHDFDDSQMCEEIWSRWYSDKEVYFDSLPDVREDNLRNHNCTMADMPIALERFMMASGSLCPSITDPFCIGFGFTQSISTTACRGVQDSAGQPKVIELSLHAMVDIQFRIEVQILNGMVMADRFSYIQTASVEVLEPSRNLLGTTNAFVVELRHDSGVALPFNTPLAALNRLTTDLDVKYDELSRQSTVSGVVASSQRGVLSKATLSWLPRDSNLTNCMRHPADYDEYLWAGSYFTNKRKTVWMSHLPFFSNCRGFGRVIPLWQVVEQGKNCRIVAEEDTVVIDRLSFGALPSGDSCGPSNDAATGPVELSCVMDEIPNEKLFLPRWFEGRSGTILFYISRRALTPVEYASIEEPSADAVPVVLIRGANSDGKLMKVVSLSLKYWQKTSKEKVLIKAEVEYSEFDDPTAQQMSGEALWEYTLKIQWEGMSHIGVMNTFAFPGDFYVLIFFATSVLLLAVMALFWAYNWTFSSIKFPPKLTDSRYVRLICQPAFKGAVLAALPCLPILMLLIMFIRGTVGAFSLPFFECAEGTALENCRIGIFDGFTTSWNGETKDTATTAQQRRRARSGVVLLAVGAYITIQSVKAFLPPAESKFYADESNEEDFDDFDELVGDDYENVGRKRRLEDSELPSDEPIFIPHIWKRTCSALMQFTMAVVALIVLQFSFSEFFMNNLWLMLLGLYILSIIVEVVLNTLVAERLLLVPAVNVLRLSSSLAVLASKDFFTFILTQFVVLAVQTVDRMYISPNKGRLLNQLYILITSVVEAIMWLLKGGDRGDIQARLRPKDTTSLVTEEFLIDALGKPMEMEENGNREVTDEKKSVEETVEEYDTRVEDMIGFLAGYSSDLVDTFLSPVSIFLCYSLYDESQVLGNYNIASEQTSYYIGFTLILTVTRLVSDILCLNSLELFQGWKLLDYFKYCHYRFSSRPHRWKGKGEPLDDSVAPHLRSLDLMCFSEQYYFCCFLSGLGMIIWIIGMQIILTARWNIFDDPASSIVFVLSIAACRLGQAATITTADYLQLWQVKESLVKHSTATVASLTAAATRKEGQVTPDARVTISAPPGSALACWPEPSPTETHASNLERYRLAFLKENKLWLQHSFDEILKDQALVKYRGILLRSLADVLGEVDPHKYIPLSEENPIPVGKVRGGSYTGSSEILTGGTAFAEEPHRFQFDAPPRHALAINKAAKSRHAYDSTVAIELSLLWVRRARFLLYLRRTSSRVRAHHLKDHCEVCGADGRNSRGLCVSPVYTHMEIANEYRRQREMSPFWNGPLWETFYSRYTRTCTLCSTCNDYYWRRNINIPISDRGRVENASRCPRSALEVLAESPYSQLATPPRIESAEGEVILRWLEWAQRRAHGEGLGWRKWISEYGYERPVGPEERTAIEDNAIDEPNLEEGKILTDSSRSDESSELDFTEEHLHSANAGVILRSWLAKARVAVASKPAPLPRVSDKWLTHQQRAVYSDSESSPASSQREMIPASVVEYGGDDDLIHGVTDA